MNLTNIKVNEFHCLENVDIDFEKEFHPSIFPIGGANGSGKTTLLDLSFYLLKYNQYDLTWVLNKCEKFFKGKDSDSDFVYNLASFDIFDGNKEITIKYFCVLNRSKDYSEIKKEFNLVFTDHCYLSIFCCVLGTVNIGVDIDNDMKNHLYLMNLSSKVYLFPKQLLSGFSFHKINSDVKTFNKIKALFPNNSFIQSFEFKKDMFLNDHFSRGELSKVLLFDALDYYDTDKAIVFIDDIEYGLHPDEQYQIPSNLMDWTDNTQFILSIHSYELCQALTPSHVKEL